MAHGNTYPYPEPQQPPLVFIDQPSVINAQTVQTLMPAQPIETQHTNGPGSGGVSANTVTLRGRGRLYTGRIQIFCGILSIVFWILSISIACRFSQYTIGLGSGLVFIVTGVFGARSSVYKRTFQLPIYLCMSIFTSVIAAVLIIVYISAATSEGWYSYHGNNDRMTRIVVDCLLLLVALVEFVNAIVGACYCCQCCCHDKNKDPRIQQYIIYTQPTRIGGYVTVQGIPADPVFMPSLPLPPPPPYSNEPPPSTSYRSATEIHGISSHYPSQPPPYTRKNQTTV